MNEKLPDGWQVITPTLKGIILHTYGEKVLNYLQVLAGTIECVAIPADDWAFHYFDFRYFDNAEFTESKINMAISIWEDHGWTEHQWRFMIEVIENQDYKVSDLERFDLVRPTQSGTFRMSLGLFLAKIMVAELTQIMREYDAQ